MTKNGDSQPTGGGAKKFLYTGPKSRDTEEDDQWTFTPRKTGSPSASGVDLDGVWSIKRNVGIGAKQQDKLNLNANKTFYSRHGGMKDRGGPQDAAENGGSWASSSRQGYSYGSRSNSQTSQATSGSRSTNKWSQDEYDF